MLRYKQIIESKKYNEFIPYAYHYNNDSIITKNGELVMIIRINSSSNEMNLKEKIQNFFNKNFIQDLSFWITSIRSKNSTFIFDNNIKNEMRDFSNKFYGSYSSFSEIENYENECYISLLIHDHVNLLNIKNIFQIVSDFDKFHYKENLRKIIKKLKKTCDSLIKELSELKPTILSIHRKDNEFYSEIELFLSKILCRNDDFIKLHKNDISATLTKNQKIKFLDSGIEIKLHESEKEKHCAIFSFKDTPSLSNQKIVNDLLDLDCEMIITEILVSSDQKDKQYIEKIKNFKKFQEFVNVGGDELLNEYNKSIKNNKNVYLKQNMIMLISDQENLNRFCEALNKKFSENGIVLYRENVATEEVFWAQLPGGFHYCTRLASVSIDKICNLNNVNTHQNTFNNKLIFSDYFFSKKSFRIKEKNFFVITGIEESALFAIDFLIKMAIGFDVQIIHFEQDKERKFLDHKFLSKSFFLNSITTKLQEEVKEITHHMLSILGVIFNDRCNKDALNEAIEYFFQNKIEYNLENFSSQIEERKIFSEQFLEKMKFIKGVRLEEKYSFISMQNFDEEQIFIIFNIYILFSIVEKICFGRNALFFFRELKRFFLNDIYNNSLLSIISIFKKYDLYLYIEIFNDEMLSLDFMKEIESTVMIFPSNEMQAIYKTLNINNEGLKFLNSITNEDKIICFKSDGKFYFAELDIQKFFSEEKNTVFNIENV